MKKPKPASDRPNRQSTPTPPGNGKSAPNADEITQSVAFRRAAADAEDYSRDPKRLRKLVEDAVGKINVIPRGPFAETWPYLMAMIRVIRAHERKEYRDVSAQNLLTIIAAIIYFVSPFDVIPDYIPILGHIDDAVVVSLALRSVRGDLEAFMAWETARV
ncbi:MAG: YkvA family protein [Chthoniobacterales bacterium]